MGVAPVVDVDPLHPGRDDLAQLGQHEVGVRPGLGERMGAHPDQERLVGLAAGVDAEVGGGGGRQQAAQGVEGLGPHRLAPDEVGVVRRLGMLRREPGLQQREELGVGVEEPVHVADVAGAERRVQDLRGAEVAVPAVREPAVVGHVAGRLLHVGHEPAPLQHLGEQVGGLLAGQVDPAELGHRVVAVLEEHPVVELLGPGQAHGGVHPVVAADVEVADELVEEEAPEALAGAGVAGEQGALDDLRQVDQGEHGPVQVGEVAPEDLGLLGGPLFGDVGAVSQYPMAEAQPKGAPTPRGGWPRPLGGAA